MAAVRVRKYLAGATATAIVVVCLVLIYATLLTFEFGEVPNAEIEHSLAVVRDARAELRPPGWEKPAYCASFSRHMESSEVAISPRELSAWKFYPRPAEPPPAPVVAVDPPGTVRAALSVPALTVAAEKSRGAVLGIALDPSDKYCAARVILVWRRKHSEPAWPKDPMLTLRVTADGSHASKPAGAIREGTGRFLYVDKPPAGRGSFVYHARALGVFRKQVTEGRGAAAKVRGVLAPKENSGVVRVRRFDTVLDGATPPAIPPRSARRSPARSRSSSAPRTATSAAPGSASGDFCPAGPNRSCPIASGRTPAGSSPRCSARRPSCAPGGWDATGPGPS